jgi:hypothetical protein
MIVAGITSVAEQQHHPMHRSHEFIVAVAPTHPLGDRQGRERGFDDGRNQIGGRRTRLGADMHQPRALIGFLPLQFGDGHAAGAGETFGGLGGLAIRTEGGTQRRATSFELTVGLPHGR